MAAAGASIYSGFVSRQPLTRGRRASCPSVVRAPDAGAQALELDDLAAGGAEVSPFPHRSRVSALTASAVADDDHPRLAFPVTVSVAAGSRPSRSQAKRSRAIRGGPSMIGRHSSRAR